MMRIRRKYYDVWLKMEHGGRIPRSSDHIEIKQESWIWSADGLRRNFGSFEVWCGLRFGYILRTPEVIELRREALGQGTEGQTGPIASNESSIYLGWK